MRHVFFILISILIIVVLVVVSSNALRKADTALKSRAEHRDSNMTIASTAFADNSPIPPKYSCNGEDINPPLSISGVPDKTQSLALIVDDPDAPMGTFVHWVVFNISPSISTVEEGQPIPGGLVGKNSSGEDKYMGPCPPSGTHHYHFKLYALDTSIEDAAVLDKAGLEKHMEGHILDQAELVGLFSK